MYWLIKIYISDFYIERLLYQKMKIGDKVKKNKINKKNERNLRKFNIGHLCKKWNITILLQKRTW